MTAATAIPELSAAVADQHLRVAIAVELARVGLPDLEIVERAVVRCRDWDGADNRVAFKAVVLFAPGPRDRIVADAHVCFDGRAVDVKLLLLQQTDPRTYYTSRSRDLWRKWQRS
jgi:hypothetical protein